MREFLEEVGTKVNEDTSESLDLVVLRVLKEPQASQDFPAEVVELEEMV